MAGENEGPIKVYFLTKYDIKAASTRQRACQYFPALNKEGFNCQISPLFDDEYLEQLFQTGKKGLLVLARAAARRLGVLWQIIMGKNYVVIIQAELFPYCPAIFEKFLNIFGIVYVLDYDDALFHQYDRHRIGLVRWLLAGKIAGIMKGAALVIAGNSYIAGYAVKSGAKRVVILPTVIDLARYHPRPHERKDDVFTIGWIGSPSTSKYLQAIVPALAEICANGQGRVILIGSGGITLPGVPVEILPWDELSEVEVMLDFDVGIMPLSDGPWERGKCGFKLIQYMACGLPVIASPVGVNMEIVEDGENGFLPTDQTGWIHAFKQLRDNFELRRSMGAKGRRKVEQKYCLQITESRLVRSITAIAAVQETRHDRRSPGNP